MFRRPAAPETSVCPSRDRLAAFNCGRLDADEDKERIAAHAEACDRCLAVLEQLDGRDDWLVELLKKPEPPRRKLRRVWWVVAGLVAVTGGAVGLGTSGFAPEPATTGPVVTDGDSLPEPAAGGRPLVSGVAKVSGRLRPETSAEFLSFDDVPAGDDIVLIGERVSVTLSSDVQVNVTAPGEYKSEWGGRPPRTVKAGVRVDSYLFHACRVPSPATGSVTFDRPVLGVIITDELLKASDAELGAPGANSVNPAAPRDRQRRGLEGPIDAVHLSSDRRTLTATFAVAGLGVDQVRVLTAARSP